MAEQIKTETNTPPDVIDTSQMQEEPAAVQVKACTCEQS